MMSPVFVRRILFGDYETPKAIRASIRLVKRMHCDRVMLFDSRGHVEPAHMDREEVIYRAGVMLKAVAAFRKAGIGVGINNLATVGMNFSPPRKNRLPFQNLVDFNEAVFTECFCPLDKGFQAHLGFQFSQWASVGADEVWVDDDFRYKTGSSQCFCPLHLGRFEQITGRSWTHQELIEALTAPGIVPNDLTRQWSAMQHDALLELAAAIAEGARQGNPNVRIAFMGIADTAPTYGSDMLRRIGRTFCPSGPVLIRPEYGSYTDESRTAWNAYMTRWCTQRAFGDDFEAWPELETWPQTGFNHGARVVEMKLVWGALHGFTSSTISVNSEPRMIRAVGRAKKSVQAIDRLFHEADWQPRGVSLEASENTVGLRPQPGYIIVETRPAHVLMRLGIPLWPNGGGGRIVVGNSPLTREDELAAFASEGMILDRPAFDLLAAMGRDDLIGGACSRPMGATPVLERYADHPDNGAAAGKIMSMELAIAVRPTLEGFDIPDSPQFTTLSTFEDADGQGLSAGVWTRSWADGRLVVLPFDLQEITSENAILNRDRQAQLCALIEWATRRPLSIRVANFPDLAVVYRESVPADRILLGLANFSLDDATDFTLVVPALDQARRVEIHVMTQTARMQSATLDVESGGVLRSVKPLIVPAQSARAVELRRFG